MGYKIVHSFLLRYLHKKENTEDFLKLFENYLDFNKRDLTMKLDEDGIQTSLIGRENISRICHQIKK
jgi:hypothetical protein